MRAKRTKRGGICSTSMNSRLRGPMVGADGPILSSSVTAASRAAWSASAPTTGEKAGGPAPPPPPSSSARGATTASGWKHSRSESICAARAVSSRHLRTPLCEHGAKLGALEGGGVCQGNRAHGTPRTELGGTGTRQRRGGADGQPRRWPGRRENHSPGGPPGGTAAPQGRLGSPTGGLGRQRG